MFIKYCSAPFVLFSFFTEYGAHFFLHSWGKINSNCKSVPSLLSIGILPNMYTLLTDRMLHVSQAIHIKAFSTHTLACQATKILNRWTVQSWLFGNVAVHALCAHETWLNMCMCYKSTKCTDFCVPVLKITLTDVAPLLFGQAFTASSSWLRMITACTCDVYFYRTYLISICDSNPLPAWAASLEGVFTRMRNPSTCCKERTPHDEIMPLSGSMILSSSLQIRGTVQVPRKPTHCWGRMSTQPLQVHLNGSTACRAGVELTSKIPHMNTTKTSSFTSHTLINSSIFLPFSSISAPFCTA